MLRKALWKSGIRYRTNVSTLPGKPDIAFIGRRVAVFCDGDFWHGRDWPRRKARLQAGHNPDYWVRKIERNIARDRENQSNLEALGWTVLRFWETEIKQDCARIVAHISQALQGL